MFHAKLRKIEDEFVVTIPESEVLRLKLYQGQMVAVGIRLSNPDQVASSEVLAIIEEVRESSVEVMKYLRDR